MNKTCPLCDHELPSTMNAAGRFHCPCCQNSFTEVELAKQVSTNTAAPDTTAAVLSLVVPGAGQFYRGHRKAGVLWLALTAAGYVMLIVPGIALHAGSVITAYHRSLPQAVQTEQTRRTKE